MRCIVLAALVALAAAAPAGAQSVPGFSVTTYSNAIDPQLMSFGASGELYVGRDELPGSGVSWRIHRVSPGGSYADYGIDATPDPDAVCYDAAGAISGVPGSVLVGGVVTGSVGRVSTIRPDGTVVTLFESTSINNPGEFKFDLTGRLCFTEVATSKVMTTTGGAPAALFTVSGGSVVFIAIDATNRIYTSSTDGNIRIHSPAGALISGSFATTSGVAAIEFGRGGDFGTDLYAGERITGNIYRINSSGTKTLFGSGFDLTGGDIAFGPDGALYVAENVRDRIIRVSGPTTSTPPVIPGGTPAARLLASPNPFFFEVTISHAAPLDRDATLSIYDMSGRRVRRLGRFDAATEPTAQWDGRDDAGRPVGAGIFFVRLEDGASRLEQKLIRLR